MTSLQVRRVRFDLDGHVPFLWNPHNPAFSMQMNTVSVLAVAFEKFIVAAVREAMPLIHDAEALAEADAFLRQEAQHSSAHREHLSALVRSHPGLQETIETAVRLFDELHATESLDFRLAYIADLEATFTPYFKLLLDNHDTLFQPGDERVASLLLWHFVEEVEHRASGLVVYGAVVPSATYRTRALPKVARHMASVVLAIVDGFNRHVPVEDRVLDASVLMPPRGLGALARQTASLVAPDRFPVPAPFAHLPLAQKAVSLGRVLLSQMPKHDPDHQPLPDFAEHWFAEYEAGADIAHWYTSQGLTPGVAAPAAPRRGTFHPLTVATVSPLTADSVAVTLDVPSELREDYAFVQGQHVAVRAEIDGADVRRTYSICAPVSAGLLRIAVKRVEGGVFSSYAVERLAPGDTLLVAPPAGRFHTELDPRHALHYAGIVGGSGITPVLSLLTTTLEVEPDSRFTLVYANRDAGSVMFADELDALVRTHLGRLRVVHVLEDAQGFVDAAKLDAWAAAGILEDVDHWFLCGPTAMAAALRPALARRGGTLHVESFTPADEHVRSSLAIPQAQLTFTHVGETASAPVVGTPLLDAALATGRDLPWSCREAQCGTCRAKLCSGTVDMVRNDVLTRAEVAAGYVLTCQSYATSPVVEVDYDA